MAFVLTLLLVMQPSGPVSAQKPGSGWSKPVNLSVDAPAPPGSAGWGKIVAAPDGYVHAFWEAVADAAQGGAANLLYHARSNGRSWSRPTNVKYSGSQSLTVPSVQLDDLGTAHALWTGNYGDRLYYRQIFVSDLDSVSAWSSPELVAEGSGIHGLVAVDHAGDTFVAYWFNNRSEIFFTKRLGAQNWTTGAIIPGTDNQSAVFSGLFGSVNSLVIDGSNRIHVAWTLEPGGSYDCIAFYARSTNEGETWSLPMQLDSSRGSEFGVDTVNIQAMGDDEVHLIWLGDAVRRHQWSTDGGRTWTATETFFGTLFGHNGMDQMAVDSLGTLHVVGIGHGQSGVATDSLWETSWTKAKGWSTPELVFQASAKSGIPYAASLAVSSGNQLDLTWRDARSIWYSNRIVDAPFVTPVPVPTMPMPTALPVVGKPPSATSSPSPTVASGFVDSESVPVVGSDLNARLAVLLGVLPVGLVVGLVMLIRLRR